MVGTARDLAKARRALAETGKPSVDLVEVDLASLSSVRKAASDLLARAKAFDVIIANAGVMACPQGKTQDGFETQFGTNHLGHFVFVNRLVPLLNPGARIVTLSSAGHQISDVDLEDPNFERTPVSGVYSVWPLQNRKYSLRGGARQQAQRTRRSCDRNSSWRNSDRARPASHARTGRAVEGTMEHRAEPKRRAIQFKSVPQGSATSVWSGFVASSDAVGGRYCEDCHVCEVNDDTSSRVGVRSYALNLAHANDLWRKSEEMVGERFPL